MKEIPKKNYYILAILLVVTIALTLLLFNLYSTKERLVSNFYEYSNKITVEEFDQFMTENSDVIIYISDKYDLSKEKIENKLSKKIDEFNLKHNLIYIDKNDIDATFFKKIKKMYGINIDLEITPLVLVIVNDEVVKNIVIDEDSNIDTLIEYEAFE